jgi:uncharacterized protein (TIGR01777 family)
MKIVLAGGSGFLGRALSEHLVGRGHEVVVLTRSGHVPPKTGARAVTWYPDGSTTPRVWSAEIEGAGAIINLAGAGIAERRWSRRRKEVLRSSRVLATRSLVAAVRAASVKPSVFLQGSAVGFYGNTGDEALDESFPPGADFLGSLCVAWEAEAHPAAALGCRLVFLRTGIALAREGGALKKLIPPFRFFVGGPIASGRQYMSWIHRADWIAMVTWALETPAVSGAVNATAPTPVRNADFSRALGRALHRPSWLRVPAFALRLIVGEMADHGLVTGQRVVPKRALELGFQFQYPEIEAAMKAAVKG